jgi:hypothetical protein
MVEMAVPNAPPMTVTSVWTSPHRLTCGLQLAQLFPKQFEDQPRPSTPPPGVYLFGVSTYLFGYQGTTLATAVLDSNLEVIEQPLYLFEPGPWG